jgi:hypothetical protein
MYTGLCVIVRLHNIVIMKCGCESLPNRPIGGQLRLREKELGEVEGEIERERKSEKRKAERDIDIEKEKGRDGQRRWKRDI